MQLFDWNKVSIYQDMITMATSWTITDEQSIHDMAAR